MFEKAFYVDPEGRRWEVVEKVVSEDGEVRKPDGSPVSVDERTGGRRFVSCTLKSGAEKKRLSLPVARLVLSTFTEFPGIGFDVDHVDGRASRDVLGNLRWRKKSENRSEGFARGSTRSVESDAPAFCKEDPWTALKKRKKEREEVEAFWVSAKPWLSRFESWLCGKTVDGFPGYDEEGRVVVLTKEEALPRTPEGVLSLLDAWKSWCLKWDVVDEEGPCLWSVSEEGCLKRKEYVERRFREVLSSEEGRRRFTILRSWLRFFRLTRSKPRRDPEAEVSRFVSEQVWKALLTRPEEDGFGLELVDRREHPEAVGELVWRKVGSTRSVGSDEKGLFEEVLKVVPGSSWAFRRFPYVVVEWSELETRVVFGSSEEGKCWEYVEGAEGVVGFSRFFVVSVGPEVLKQWEDAEAFLRGKVVRPKKPRFDGLASWSEVDAFRKYVEKYGFGEALKEEFRFAEDQSLKFGAWLSKWGRQAEGFGFEEWPWFSVEVD